MRKILLLVALLVSTSCFAQTNLQNSVPTGPRALIVIAHPDDESGFAATIYKITHDLHGHVDLALITNGEGGYKYSTLAEPYYGLELTDEKVGREYLPTIRKQELMNAGKILGIRNFFFFDQRDHRYTKVVEEAFDSVWNLPLIQNRLNQILTNGNYDFIFTLLPTDSTHGHHKGATIMALQAVQNAHLKKQPIVLGGTIVMHAPDTTTVPFLGLKNYPVTNVNQSAPQFYFDRTVKFGYNNVLSYKIIVNWEIAEHKSQGTVQLGMDMGDMEKFYYYAINPPDGIEKTRKLFDDLKVLHFVKKTY